MRRKLLAIIALSFFVVAPRTASATDEDIAGIIAAVTGVDSVVRILDLRTQHIGPEDLLVAGKLEFDHGLTNPQISDAIDAVEAAMRAAVPVTLHIYLEPDLYDPGRSYEPGAFASETNKSSPSAEDR